MNNPNNISRLRLTVVAILYNIELDQSASFKSIKGQSEHHLNVNLILWDNSPVPVREIDKCDELNHFPFRYFHTPENLSLAKIYNRIVETETFDYILLLDQDTKLPENYFSLIQQAISDNLNNHLFLPIVKNRDHMVSPGQFQFFKGIHLKTIQSGLLPSKNLLAVASGMVISKKVFSKFKIRFDERLNLYGIDSKFMFDYARKEKFLIVLPVVLDHHSAMWSNPTADELLPRFKNLKKAWSILLSDQPIVRSLNRMYYTVKSIIFSIKFRDIRFLK